MVRKGRMNRFGYGKEIRNSIFNVRFEMCMKHPGREAKYEVEHGGLQFKGELWLGDEV